MIGANPSPLEPAMTEPHSDPEPNKNGTPDLKTLAHELQSEAERLQREAERLQKLALELKAREEADAEMRQNYPHFKAFVYGWLREKCEREIPPLPEDVDLETYAAQQGAVSIEPFLQEWEEELKSRESNA